jgi:PKD repeat protein
MQISEIMKSKLLILALIFIQFNFMKGQCSASFTFSNNGNGNISFTSTSTGTTVNTGYYWDFDDGNFFSSLSPTTSHNYQNGIYTPTLSIYDSITQCSSTIALTFTVSNAPCTGSVSFFYSLQQNGLVNFVNNSPGMQNFNWGWAFGDGGTSNQFSPSHTYTSSGVYNVTLTAVDQLNICSYSAVQSITVTVGSCSLTAGYTYSLGNNGQVFFTSTSTGTTGNTYYYWDFGDGGYSNVINPMHTYMGNGTYSVNLLLLDSTYFSCNDIYGGLVNYTPCIANVSFNMLKDSTQLPAIVWDAYPSYPGNIVSATWNWGDGSTTNGLYPSHTYSAAGMYNICVTISVSCGATATVCSNTNIYRQIEGAQNMSAGATVNVINAIPTAIKANETQLSEVKIFPNPNSGEFEIRAEGLGAEASVHIFNILGEKVFESKLESNGSKKISMADVSSGCYLVKIISGEKSANSRIIITR